MSKPLFYCSKFELKAGNFLDARKSDLLGKNVVYACRNKGAAATFLVHLGSHVQLVEAKKWTGKDWKGDSKWMMIEQYIDGFKVFHEAHGWLYQLKDDGFKTDPLIASKAYDVFSTERAEIVAVEEIKDVRAFMEKNGVVFVTYDEKIKALSAALL
jgi:hypothetical protein